MIKCLVRVSKCSVPLRSQLSSITPAPSMSASTIHGTLTTSPTNPCFVSRPIIQIQWVVRIFERQEIKLVGLFRLACVVFLITLIEYLIKLLKHFLHFSTINYVVKYIGFLYCGLRSCGWTYYYTQVFSTFSVNNRGTAQRKETERREDNFDWTMYCRSVSNAYWWDIRDSLFYQSNYQTGNDLACGAL